MAELTSKALHQAFESFLDEVFETGIIWGISNGEGWAITESEDFEDRQAMPFWSSESRAKQVCEGEWQDYKPMPIDFDDFIDDWLHGMHEDEVLVGLNWDSDLEGPELEPLFLMDEMLEEDE